MILVECLKQRIGVAPSDLGKNGEDLATELPGLLQLEQSVHFSALGDSSFDPQVGQSQPLI
jgi:hypothetical protein